MVLWICHHHPLLQARSFGHTCLVTCTKTAKAMTDTTRSSASFHHFKTVRKSGETTTATSTIQMLMEAHPDHSTSSLQTRSRTLINWGISHITTRAMTLQPMQWKVRMCEWAPSNTQIASVITASFRAQTTQINQPSVAFSNRQSWTWVLSSRMPLRNSPSTQLTNSMLSTHSSKNQLPSSSLAKVQRSTRSTATLDHTS